MSMVSILSILANLQWKAGSHFLYHVHQRYWNNLHSILHQYNITQNNLDVFQFSLAILSLGFGFCFKGCMELLSRSGVTVKGKRAVVVGRSNIVGLPVSLLLLKADATVSIVHSRTPDPESIVREADIVIAAAGQAMMVCSSTATNSQFLQHDAVSWNSSPIVHWVTVAFLVSRSKGTGSSQALRLSMLGQTRSTTLPGSLGTGLSVMLILQRWARSLVTWRQSQEVLAQWRWLCFWRTRWMAQSEELSSRRDFISFSCAVRSVYCKDGNWLKKCVDVTACSPFWLFQLAKNNSSYPVWQIQ